MPRAKTPEERQETRELICQVGERLFVERGVNGVSMRDLGAELGLSPMAPYRYFKDKAEILAAVRAAAFSRFSDTIEAAFDSGKTPTARARAIGTAYLGFAIAEPNAYRLIFDMTQPDEDQYPELAFQSARAREILSRQSTDLIAAGLAPDDIEEVTHSLWSAAHGVCVLYMAGKFSSADSAREAYRNTMRWLFVGLHADAQKPSRSTSKPVKETP
ncbi:TetR/AcrR family transcriptional regulator [Variovorax rhizosphaerae]|uniref:TetR/AcrR family transcriptional regulator n=1 Tax=Variovorax rhizosphaerae TaxID=1836200 RepID=A0ABU8WL19_9BURK